MSSIRRLSAVPLVSTILTPAAALIGGNLFGFSEWFSSYQFCRDLPFRERMGGEHEQAASVVAVGGIIDEEN